MPNTPGHRRFGNIRKLTSGRYQVRCPGTDGLLRPAPRTFARKEEAQRWLTLTEAEITRGDWIDPDKGTISLSVYATNWIAERPGLRPRTMVLYRQLLRTHIAPTLGPLPLSRITTPTVRQWRSGLLDKGVSRGVAAKAYRLLRAVLNTAVKEDELIRANPCRIPGADKEDAPERPVLSMPQVFALSAAVPERFRALILLTTFGSLRWGEVTALLRRDLDLGRAAARVRHAFNDRPGGGMVLGPPKSRAGLRTVSLPPALIPALTAHLVQFVPDDPDGLVFTGPSSHRPPLRRNNFRKLARWEQDVAAIGAPGLHFHDPRHTGNTLASKTGASTRDLMTRMGHDSPRAALLYQHATAEADRGIADALSEALQALMDAGQRSAIGPPPTLRAAVRTTATAKRTVWEA